MSLHGKRRRRRCVRSSRHSLIVRSPSLAHLCLLPASIELKLICISAVENVTAAYTVTRHSPKEED